MNYDDENPNLFQDREEAICVSFSDQDQASCNNIDSLIELLEDLETQLAGLVKANLLTKDYAHKFMLDLQSLSRKSYLAGESAMLESFRLWQFQPRNEDLDILDCYQSNIPILGGEKSILIEEVAENVK